MIHLNRSFLALLVIIFIALVSCAGDTMTKEDTKTEKENKGVFGDLKDATDELEKVLNGDGELSEPVNFRELKELLPKGFNGFDRTNAEGSTQGAAGVKMSNAQGEYEDGDGGKISIHIIDAGGVSMIVKGMASWANLEIDKESDDEYTRTTEIDGHKAYEKYNNIRRSGETALLVNDRFIVTIKGRKVSEKDIRKAIDKLDLKDLAKLVK